MNSFSEARSSITSAASLHEREDEDYFSVDTKACIRLSRPKTTPDALAQNLHVALQELCLHHAGLDSKNVDPLISSLCNKKYLCKLSLAFNRLGDTGTAKLKKLLVKAPRLKYLNLARNHISKDGCAALSEGLRECKSLRHLDITENLCGDDGIISICNAGKFCQWTDLVLSKNRMGRKGVAGVATLLRDSKTLQSLACYLNGIDYQGAIMLADALMINKSLQVLDVAANPLGSRGLFSFASMLGRNSTLKSLDLRGCDILREEQHHLKSDGKRSVGPSPRAITKASAVGWEKLCSQLRNDSKSKLESLRLSFNPIGDSEVRTLCSALEKNKNLRALSLSNCDISPKGISYIGTMIRKSSLTALDLALNTVDKYAAKALGSGLKENLYMEYLDLTQCRMRDSIAYIAQPLTSNTKLRTLLLGGNLLERKHLLPLSQTLMSNTYITDIGQVACRCEFCEKRGVKNMWQIPKYVSDDVKQIAGKVAGKAPGYASKFLSPSEYTSESEKSGCIRALLNRNRQALQRKCRLAFLMGLHKSSNSSISKTLGSSSIAEQAIL
eukprot:CAMPEP_0167759710 /NCGR_PEP_ID=MMETSP0110_2-20121227/11173_1 /TAXON_ID=629695 /ORGANISM="Gymnochlora sp., Strain CCMP2014" /LENGTH=555 /DNA_ID=CAMNT_0007646123 /DNA_START=37 /DNA_END=1700 /DNA_ORIENTATION=+